MCPFYSLSFCFFVGCMHRNFKGRELNEFIILKSPQAGASSHYIFWLIYNIMGGYYMPEMAFTSL